MVLSAVVTTSASSATMNEAIEVRARTKALAFAGVMLVIVMNRFPDSAGGRFEGATAGSAVRATSADALKTAARRERIRPKIYFGSAHPLDVAGRLQRTGRRETIPQPRPGEGQRSR